MASDRHARDPVAELAREAVRLLAERRAAGIEEAIDRAYAATRVDPSTRRPTRAELRAHAQAFEESEHGEAGRLLRIDATLVEISEVLAHLEETVIARDADGAERPPPEVYGRAAKGELDLDPTVHIRVTTTLPVSVLAQALFDAGFGDPLCRSVATRHGRLDEIAFEGACAEYRIVRIPPRLKTDPDLDLVRGHPVEHADFSGIARRISGTDPRSDTR